MVKEVVKQTNLPTEECSSTDHIAEQSGQHAPNNGLAKLWGLDSNSWNSLVANQVIRCLPASENEAAKNRQIEAAIAGMADFQPKDAIEAMMASQLLGAHVATMECYWRAMHGNQTLEGRRENLNQANKLSRTFANLTEALNRHRGKGQQKITVEHVNVHAGGKAIVGAVAANGGDGNS
jgi:hypothetical protein